MTWPTCLLGVLMSFSAMYLKPELFSFIFMVLMTGLWFYTKSMEDKTKAIPFYYLFPLIMLIWVNTHGVFVFGCCFLLMAGTGEGINFISKNSQALPSNVFGHFFASLILSAGTIFVTPYGWRYPLHLASGLLFSDYESRRVVDAYLSIFSPRMPSFGLSHYFFGALIILAILLVVTIRKKKIDWAIILSNLLFGYLYTVSVRSTYYWTPLVGFTVLYLINKLNLESQPANGTWKTGVNIILTVCSVFYAGYAMYTFAFTPKFGRWCGLGIGYNNPVAASRFIAKYLPNYHIGNDYISGAYLLWTLGPTKKVFIDPRQFPFREWQQEYIDFIDGHGIEEGFKRFKAPVWCLNLRHKKVITWLNNSEKWRPVFYDASAAVFVEDQILLPPDAPWVAKNISGIRNLDQALNTVWFAVSIRDWESAKAIVETLDIPFRTQGHKTTIKGLAAYVKGMKAFSEGNHDDAVTHLTQAQRHEIKSGIKALNRSRNILGARAWDAGRDQEAYDHIMAAFRLNSEDPHTLFNAGVLAWYRGKMAVMNKKTPQKHTIFPNRLKTSYQRDARVRLTRFLSSYGKFLPPQIVADAKAILADTYSRRPYLIRPNNTIQ